MNRRGMAILLLSSIGFLVAVMLFFNTVDNVQTVGNSTFLGESQAEVLGAYSEGERIVIFLENAARLSAKEEDFAASFSSYLSKANRLFGMDIGLQDFDVELSDGLLVAVAKKQVEVGREGVRYRFIPSFSVRV